MYCPACGAANVDGAKFCGACGARLEAPAPVAPVAVAPTTADTAATVVRPPLVDDASLMPRSRGRGRVVAVVAIDLALVIGGLVLWTRSPTTAPASPRTGGAGAVATTDGDARGVDGAVGSGALPGGGGSPAAAGDRSVAAARVAAAGGSRAAAVAAVAAVVGGGGGGPGTGSAAVPGAVDARSLDDLLTDAGPGPVPTVDAAALEPGAPDASTAVEPPALDAAVAAPELADAATADPADADDGEVSAQVVEQQFNRLAVASESKLRPVLPDRHQGPAGRPADRRGSGHRARGHAYWKDRERARRSQHHRLPDLGQLRPRRGPGSWSFSPHTAAGPLRVLAEIPLRAGAMTAPRESSGARSTTPTRDLVGAQVLVIDGDPRIHAASPTCCGRRVSTSPAPPTLRPGSPSWGATSTRWC
jgi:hypothetical protein